jgi:cytochrome c biogenesis protein CcdA
VGVLIYLGASKFDISTLFNTYGEKLLGPLLIIIGLFMLGVIKFGKVTGVGVSQKVTDKISGKGYISALLMGIVFALAFCPYSGVLYFGMLIPMSVKDDGSLINLLPFSIGTGLPVIIISLILAYGLAGVGSVFNKIKTFEKWFRKIVGLIFVLTGIYYIMIFMELV